MKQRIITSVIALSLLATVPAWGQTTVIKRTETKQAAKPKTVNQWEYKGDYRDGLAKVKDNNGKYGFVDKSGKLVIPCQWEWAAPYEAFWYLNLFSGFCFVLDYILRWMTADFEMKKNRKWESFVCYPFTPMAIIDLLSILPVFNLLNPTFKVARLTRLLMTLRVFKAIRYFEPLEIVLSVIRSQRKILLTVLSLALFYIFITALIMFNAEEDINPETGKYLFETFFEAFYWAACTLTTVGYGDLYPISSIGRVISIISSMVGIAIIALPSGIITAGYMDEQRSRREKKEPHSES